MRRTVLDTAGAVAEADVVMCVLPDTSHGKVYGSDIVELFRLVKLSFDPLGILNPGVILPSGELPISRLKVGSRAVTLPSDVERGLREIERGGGYARSRLELAGELGAGS